jgi:hypothetical protein
MENGGGSDYRERRDGASHRERAIRLRETHRYRNSHSA